METKVRILLQAKDKKGNMHDVKEISMGKYTTYVKFMFYEKELSENSIDYEFYIGGEKIDIYASALFNTYMEADCYNLIKIVKEIKTTIPGDDDLPF